MVNKSKLYNYFLNNEQNTFEVYIDMIKEMLIRLNWKQNMKPVSKTFEKNFEISAFVFLTRKHRQFKSSFLSLFFKKKMTKKYNINLLW